MIYGHLKIIHISTHSFLHQSICQSIVNMSIHPSVIQKTFVKHPVCVPAPALATVVTAAKGKFRIGCSQVTKGCS